MTLLLLALALLGDKKAPEFVGATWLNTPGGKPLTLASQKGRPTLVAFWTFGCSNCQANFPAYDRLYEKYKPQGVELVAIHTPEMRIERDLDEVVRHVKKNKIAYPVLIDNDGKNWNAWKVDCWPTIYVVDGKGFVRGGWIGELAWQGADGEKKISNLLDTLLKERA